MYGEIPTAARLVETTYPAFGEEYLEWIDVLEAVAEAGPRFTTVELGAGWGRWLINGAAAARQCGVSKLCLVGVEAEPTRFLWMQQHFADNGIGPRSRRLVQAAVTTRKKRVSCHIGDSSAWCGQAIEFHPPRSPFVSPPGLTNRSVMKVPTVTPSGIVWDLDEIDLIHADVQGVEADVFESAGALLRARVKKSSHRNAHSENERRLRVLFASLGWERVNDYPFGAEADNPRGRIRFHDGVQTWRNPEAPTRSH